MLTSTLCFVAGAVLCLTVLLQVTITLSFVSRAYKTTDTKRVNNVQVPAAQRACIAGRRYRHRQNYSLPDAGSHARPEAPHHQLQSTH